MTGPADELAAAAENLLANMWRYCYEDREENADGERIDGKPAEERLRAAVAAYRTTEAE